VTIKVKIRAVEEHEMEAVRQLLLANGWGHRVGNAPQFQTLIRNSDYAIVALADDVIVGFARALCDRQSNGYVSMLVVSSKYRRLGIGRSLMENLLEHGEGITWVLRASRAGAKEFFSSLGFASSTDAMELKRQ
jgi:ribosomal protein S18 acetylase RimI-like enzyme